MMAGSYNHAVTDDGRLRNQQTMTIATETPGDAYETIEEMFGMIWWLAKGLSEAYGLDTPAAYVEQARRNYQIGLTLSPGIQADK
jgi:hypothetical protein